MDLIVIMGPPGSGKTTIGKELEKSLPWSFFVSMGEYIRNIQGLPPFKGLNHFDVIKSILMLAKEKHTPLLIIDANPYPENTVKGLKYLRKNCCRTLFIEIQCNERVILERLRNRERGDTDKDFTNNDRVDYYNTNISKEISKIRDRVSFINENTGDVSRITRQIMEIYETAR